MTRSDRMIRSTQRAIGLIALGGVAWSSSIVTLAQPASYPPGFIPQQPAAQPSVLQQAAPQQPMVPVNPGYPQAQPLQPVVAPVQLQPVPRQGYAMPTQYAPAQPVGGPRGIPTRNSAAFNSLPQAQNTGMPMPPALNNAMPMVPIQNTVMPVQHQEPIKTANNVGVGGLPVMPVAQMPAADLVQTLTPRAGEHPLAAAIRWAQVQVPEVEKIRDYSATLVKRERVDGVLGDQEFMFVKVRHQPFSVYVYFLGPEKVKGQECMFVEGQNDGKMWAHANGMKHRLLGTVSLLPTSSFAMAGNRYPVTELGVKRLTTRLIEVGNNDMKFGECEVRVIPGAKINARDCTCVQVTHPTPRKEFLYHIARIYVDNQLNLPVRFEAYEWPTAPGVELPLVEEYTYLNIKVNNGFTDQDFDIRNPNYQFK